MRSAFPLSTSDLVALQQQQQQQNNADSGSKVRRQKSNKETTVFTSLPHDTLSPGPGGGNRPVVHSGKTRRPQNRSQSTDPREKSRFRPLSMFQPFGGGGGGGGAGWFNPGYVWREAGPELTGNFSKTEAAAARQQWYLQERRNGPDSLLHSMPVMLGGGGGGVSLDTNSQLSRSDRSRSSFGMILKDRFQKNPNMYFPDTSRTPSRTPPEDKKQDKKKKEASQDDLSDTDTLIRNMSEGSFDKDSSSISGGGRSFDSAKSDRSSGKSSLSQDSMDGTPKMIRRRQPESITTPKAPSTTAVHLASNPSVILNKKTIRNYTPMESSALLRQFEETRHNTLERRGGRIKANSESMSAEIPEEESGEQESPPIQRKSSVDRLIEDFHRSLPPPPPTREEDEEAIEVSGAGGPFSDSVLSGTGDRRAMGPSPGGGGGGLLAMAKKQQSSHHSKSGTVNSQASIWSVGSSVASFDYHTVTSLDKGPRQQPPQKQHSLGKSTDRINHSSNSGSGKKLGGGRLSNSTVDLSTGRDPGSRGEGPAGVRVPPEGAAASDPSPRSSFVQRIEVRADLQRRSESIATDKKPPGKPQQQQQRKSGKEAAREEVADLLQPQETGDDELVMLKRLISEGRISGLNDKPPAFKPPTPPSKTASTAKKAKAPKSPAPKTPDVNKTSSNRQGGGSPVKGSEERPRKNREAPPPPPTTSSHPIKAQPETSEIKFISGRRIHSVEDLQEEDQRQRRPEREGRREERSEAVQRSTSMHLTRGKRRNCLLQVLYSMYI